jgi:hypothetical protein
MFVIATHPVTDAPDNVDIAVREHRENPHIPVTRLCKDHGVARATFYRRLKKTAKDLDFSVPDLYPKAASNPPPEDVSTLAPCLQDCGTILDRSGPDDDIFLHLLACPGSDITMRHDARRILEEHGCPIPSHPLSSTSTSSIPTAVTTPRQWGSSGEAASVTASLSTHTPNQPDDVSDPWSTVVRDIKTSVWGVVPYEPDELYTSKYYLGEVVPDWDYLAWMDWRWELVPKASTRNCNTATRPSRRAWT